MYVDLSRSAFGGDVEGDNVVSLLQGNLRASVGVSSGCAANAGKDVHRGHGIVGRGRHRRYVDGVIHQSRVNLFVREKAGFNPIPLNLKSFKVESLEGPELPVALGCGRL